MATTRSLRTVRARTTIVATGVFAIAFVVAAVALVRVVDSEAHDRAMRSTRAALEGAAQQLAAGATPTRIQAALKQPVYYQVYDAAGTLLAGYAGEPLAERNADGKWTLRAPTSGHWIILPRRVQYGTGATITLVVAASLESTDRSITALRRKLWVVTPMLIALVAALAWVLVGRALRPVEAIRSQVAAISGSTIDRRVPVPDSGDEVERLASTMNDMLDRLEQAQLRQREFVSDASHELRSPIASMRAELEVALAHPERAEWPLVAQRVLGERDRLERLVDDLLQLARLDEGAALRHTDVDLDDLVLEEAAHARRVPVSTAAVSAGRVIGDPHALAQVVRNLLDNAARHARTAVRVEVGTEGSDVVLRVDDDGPGVGVADRQRIFERFTRADDGRGRVHGGAGLGLALVERVVRATDGSVVCSEAPMGGARFEVRLPAAVV